MLKRILLLLLILLVSGSVLNAQDQNKLNTYIERAFKFKGDGLFETALITWDLYLKEVQKTEGEECLHYFMGVVYKSEVLINAGRYEDAEKLLLSTKLPDGQSDLRLELNFYKNLGKCAFLLSKYDEAIALYSNAYDTLLENKDFYPEENFENYHWCWSDEICFIALDIAKVLVADNDYTTAETVLRSALASIRQDNETCLEANGDGLYYSYLRELFNTVEQQAIMAMQKNDYNNSNSYFLSACDILQSFPFAGLIDHDLIKYIVFETAKNDSRQAKKYADTYLALDEATLRSWYGIVEELTLEYIPKAVSLNSTFIARIFEKCGLFDEAEYYHLYAIKVLEESFIYDEELVDAHKYINMAHFLHNYKGDYVEALRFHFEDFNKRIKLYGKDDTSVFDSFYNMLISYENSIVMLQQLGVDGQFNLHNPQMPVPDLTYEHCIDVLYEWRCIVENIISKYGNLYFDSLIQYADITYREGIFQLTGQTYDSHEVNGTISQNYYYEVIANIYFDKLKEFDIALHKLREVVSPTIPEYLEFINNISRTLENKGYIQTQIGIWAEEYDCLLRNHTKFTEAKVLAIADYLRVKIIQTSLRHRFYDIAIYHINNDLEIWGPYGDTVPKYTTADVYVDKLLAIAWGCEVIDGNFDEMLRYTEMAESVLRGNQVYMHNIKEGLVYQNKARYYLEKQDYIAAEDNQIKAISLSDTVKDHLKEGWPVTMYQRLAEIYLYQKNYDAAISILDKCVEHCKLPIAGVDSIISYIYGSLVVAYEGNKQDQEMADAARDMYSTRLSYFQDMSFGLRKVNLMEAYYGENIPIFLEAFTGSAINNPLMVDVCYDVALTQKGFLINFDAMLFDNVQRSGDKELIIRYHDYKDAEKSQSDSLWFYESRFLAKYTEHEEFKEHNNTTTWKNVQRQLGKNDLAVEFTICYKEDSNSYAALLLKKDWDSPKMIELCEESELKRIMAGGARLYKENAAAYSCIWEKLEPYFKKGDNIYFAPHGLIHQLNIEVLCGKDGKPMNKKCNLYRLSSTGNLVEDRDDLKYNSATLYGGLNYDTDTTSMLAINRNYVTTSSLQRGRLLDESVQTRTGWDYLPGTAEEVRNVGNILDRNRIETTIYTNEAGTEEAFKALSGNSTPIIHIATHGFYLEDKKARKEGLFEFAYTDNVQTISPLKRSGLIFSGGQHAWLGMEIPEGIDDGVLTAEEIAGMNLTGTDLLVLSACQTGLGEITSEGVEGLQRGFKIAGVNTIIMSLWEVSDLATETMMTAFYKSLTNGNSKREAFDAAINKVREKTIKMEKSGELRELHPRDPHLWIAEGHWAAFIMLD